jgi:hypothetical protein
MSLLDRVNEDVIVFLEEEYTDSDGNVMVRPSTTGFSAQAMIQPAAQSGTSARRAEQDNEGFETEENYRVRFSRSFPYELKPQSRLEWRGEYWSVVGFPVRYSSSRRTRHLDYMIRRT